MRLSPFILRFLAIVSLATPSLLHAAPTDTETTAEEHSKRGVEFYAEGELPEAVREMLKAYELVPEPGLLYNIARIYQKMGEEDLATHYFKKFVTFEGADPDRVQKALTHLEDLKAKPKPAPELEAQPAPADPPQSGDATAPPGNAEAAPVSGEANPTRANDSKGNFTAWSLIGGGGTGVALGVVLGTLALKNAGDLDDPLLTYDDKLASQQSSRDLALGADISMALGIAATGTGLLVLLSSDKKEHQTVSVRPSLGQGNIRANVTVRLP